MNKIKLRKLLKLKRDKIKKAHRKKFSKIIIKKFLKYFEQILKNKKNIMLYISFKSEVETKSLIKFLLKKKLKVYVPVIIDEKVHPVRLKVNDKFKKGKFNILEPAKKIKLTNFNLLDIIIIPGICFDKKGNRIGFGKGYFDRFLSKLDKKIIKIGFAFSKQIVKKIPAKKHDIKMDYIITEREIINCKGSK